jgi:phosphatidylserine/phosphatidylglycerophosphate/cardiolipin synthase-like enzyme
MLALTTIIERMTKVDSNESASAEEVRALTSQIMTIASTEPQRLERELTDTLEDVARHIDRVGLAVTGLAWLGSGAQSVEQALTGLVENAQREIVICAYTITPSALPFISKVEDIIDQGVKGTIAINDFAKQSPQVQFQLKNACRKHPERWRLLDFAPSNIGTQLHAKLLVVDRTAALVGSANLSFHGMSLNHEMAVLLRGPIAESLAARVDLLLTRTHPVSLI